MKALIGRFSMMAILATTIWVRGQGFVDLNFESAHLIYDYTNGIDRYVATTNALPGWNVFFGTNPLSQIAYDPCPCEAVTNSFLSGGTNYVVPEGKFSFFLTAGTSISQEGLVPTGAEWLLFDLVTNWGTASVEAFLNGNSFSYTAISNVLTSYGWSYTVYGAEISAFSGQMANLVFSGKRGVVVIDDIRFSSAPVPEPGVFSLVCFGSGALLYVIRRRHR